MFCSLEDPTSGIDKWKRGGASPASFRQGIMLCPVVPSTSPSKPQEASHILRYPITNSTLHPKQRGRVTTPKGKTWSLVGQTTAVKLDREISTARKSANHPSAKLTPGSSLNMHVASRVYLNQTWDTPIATPHPNPLTPMVNDQKSRRCSKSKRDYKSQKGHFRQVACCGSKVFLFFTSK